MPKISVVIPAYNHERFVAETIRSVLDQTFQDFEIVIVDDGSTDGTVKAIEGFNDPRIRLFRFEKNQSACEAVEKCILESSGGYIAVLSSDDAFLPRKLEIQNRFLDEQPKIGAVFSYAAMMNEESRAFTDGSHPYLKIFRKENRSRFEWLNYFFKTGNCLCHPSVLIRRECYDAVGLYDKRFAQLPDFDFWVRLCMKYEIHVLPEELVRFRVRKSDAGASGDRPDARIRIAWETSRILRNYLNLKDAGELLKVFPETAKHEKQLLAGNFHYILAMLALETGKTAHRLFAVETLHELLSDAEDARKLEADCGFTYKDFIRLTGETDIFNMMKVEKYELLRNTHVWKLLSKIGIIR